MEAPGNVHERLCLAYDTRIVELKAEFFHRVAKLKQCLEELANVSVSTFSEICKFLRDTYELAQADHEAAITTGIWQTPAFVDLYAKTLETTLAHAEKLLIRHLKGKNLAAVANVLSVIIVLPGSIDVTKVLFHSALDLLSEEYEETLFESSDDPFIERLTLYSLHRSHLWKLNSCRTPGSRWLLYACEQSCYQGDFFEHCLPGLYRTLLGEIFHIHTAHRNTLRVGSQANGDLYAFVVIAGEIVQMQAAALSRRKPNPSCVLKSLASFGFAREQLQLESSRSSSAILTPTYFSFLILLQTAAHFYSKELSSGAQGDSTIHKLMLMYCNLSELLYCFFGMLSEPKPYVERLVTEYEMEWQFDSVAAARGSELPASIIWLRYMRCLALDSFHIRLQASIAKVCDAALSPSSYDLQNEVSEPLSFVPQLLDLVTAHYEQSALCGRSTRVMVRKTLAVAAAVIFKETRKRVRDICVNFTAAGVARLSRDVSLLLEGVCALTIVRSKAGYVRRLKGLREVLKWRDTLLALMSDGSEIVSEGKKRWRSKLRDSIPDRRAFSDVSILQMQVLA